MEELDLSKSEIRDRLSKEVSENIDEYCKVEYNDGHRNHLGASMIGDNCSRKLWYIFRWVKLEEFNGRIQRLFNRGHREEERFIEWLEGIGCKVYSDDLENNKLFFYKETGEYILENTHDCSSVEHPEFIDVSDDEIHVKRAKAGGLKFPQYRVSGVNGHYGGSCDLQIELAPRFNYNKRILGECKTHNTGAGFNNIRKNGIEAQKYKHFCQMSSYGPKLGIEYGAYFCINKNDDDLIVEFVKLNSNLGAQMELKAEKVIYSRTPPDKLSNNSTFFECKMCNFNDICHKGALVEKNCRSCKFALPIENGQWGCEKFQNEIPKDFIPNGCNEYYPITAD